MTVAATAKGTLSILIVDDEKNMRWVLAQALEADGYDKHFVRRNK